MIQNLDKSPYCEVMSYIEEKQARNKANEQALYFTSLCGKCNKRSYCLVRIPNTKVKSCKAFVIQDSYAGWALSCIALIAEEQRINSVVKIEEIKCIIRHDGHYPESYKNGDSPEEAWQSEMQAIEDSQ